MERYLLKRLNAQAKRLERAASKSNKNQVRQMQRLLKTTRRRAWETEHA